jgi:hypothetical protein
MGQSGLSPSAPRNSFDMFGIGKRPGDSRMIRPAELVRGRKLLAQPTIFGAKSRQFPAKCFN